MAVHDRPDRDLQTKSICNSGALRRASRRVSQLYDRMLAPSGLKITQLGILSEIDRRGPTALNELAQALVMDRSTLGHNLRPLQRDGLVGLVVDELDRRSRRIGLTPAGKRKLAAARELWGVAQKQFESAFGAEHASALRDVLRVLSSEDFVEAFEQAATAE